MIELTQSTGEKFIINSDLIEKVEELPHTLITLVNGKKYIVLEKNDEVREKVISYKRLILTKF